MKRKIKSFKKWKKCFSSTRTAILDDDKDYKINIESNEKDYASNS